MKKRIIYLLSMIAIMLPLTGCGGGEDKKTEESKISDIKLIQSGNSYMTKDDSGKIHHSKDEISVRSFNNYQCIDTKIEYDAESDRYICIIEFGQVIEE